MKKIINKLRQLRKKYFDSHSTNFRDKLECYQELWRLYRHDNLTAEQYELAKKLIYIGGGMVVAADSTKGKREYLKEWYRFLDKYDFVPGYHKAEEIYKAFKKEYFNDNGIISNNS